MTTIKVVKLGIRFDPPTLALVYHDPIGKCDRLHRIDLSTSLFSPPDVAADTLVCEEYYCHNESRSKLSLNAWLYMRKETDSRVSWIFVICQSTTIGETITKGALLWWYAVLNMARKCVWTWIEFSSYRLLLQVRQAPHSLLHQPNQHPVPPWHDHQHCPWRTWTRCQNASWQKRKN